MAKKIFDFYFWNCNLPGGVNATIITIEQNFYEIKDLAAEIRRLGEAEKSDLSQLKIWEDSLRETEAKRKKENLSRKCYFGFFTFSRWLPAILRISFGKLISDALAKKLNQPCALMHLPEPLFSLLHKAATNRGWVGAPPTSLN